MAKVFFSNLNGFRALAALAVIMAHCSYWLPSPANSTYEFINSLMTFNRGEAGRLGVIFFFILSGFLISYLLLEEINTYGKINIKFFYLRRLFRIWPLYFFVLFIGFFVFPIFVKDNSFVELANFWLYAGFMANFDHIYNYFPSSSILGVQWSVSVEEQFYLFWPLLFGFILRYKWVIFLLFLLIISSECYFLFFGLKLQAGDYHLLSCLKYLFSGALLAYLTYYKPKWFLKVLKYLSSRFLIVFIYLFAFSVMLNYQQLVEYWKAYTYISDVVPLLFFMFVILEQNYVNSSFYKISAIPYLDWLGKRSYGMYLLHMVVLNAVVLFLPKNENYFLAYVFLVLIGTILLSHWSYTYLERYFLKFNSKFRLIDNGN